MVRKEVTKRQSKQTIYTVQTEEENIERKREGWGERTVIPEGLGPVNATYVKIQQLVIVKIDCPMICCY